jgi:hypothetical protein
MGLAAKRQIGRHYGRLSFAAPWCAAARACCAAGLDGTVLGRHREAAWLLLTGLSKALNPL